MTIGSYINVLNIVSVYFFMRRTMHINFIIEILITWGKLDNESSTHLIWFPETSEEFDALMTKQNQITIREIKLIIYK